MTGLQLAFFIAGGAALIGWIFWGIIHTLEFFDKLKRDVTLTSQDLGWVKHHNKKDHDQFQSQLRELNDRVVHLEETIKEMFGV